MRFYTISLKLKIHYLNNASTTELYSTSSLAEKVLFTVHSCIANMLTVLFE